MICDRSGGDVSNLGPRRMPQASSLWLCLSPRAESSILCGTTPSAGIQIECGGGLGYAWLARGASVAKVVEL